jgi:predicted nucleic acid-binding Zn ribbon protein
MKKPYRYNELDPKRTCSVCKKPMKKNLLEKKPNAEKCFSCLKPERKENKRKNREKRLQAIKEGKVVRKTHANSYKEN